MEELYRFFFEAPREAAAEFLAVPFQGQAQTVQQAPTPAPQQSAHQHNSELAALLDAAEKALEARKQAELKQQAAQSPSQRL